MAMIEQFMSSPFFIPTLAVASFVAGVVVYQKVFSGDDQVMEEEALEDLVTDEIVDITESWGIEYKKPVSYSMFPKGKVDKAYNIKKFSQAFSDVMNDIDMDELEDELEDADLSSVNPADVVSKLEDAEENVEDITEDIWYLKIVPSSKISRMKMRITDDILNLRRSTEYILVKDKNLSDGAVLHISNNYQPQKVAPGVWIPDDELGAGWMAETTYKAMFEDTLETVKDAIRSINKMNLQMVENLEEIEKLKELESGNLKDQLEDYMEGG